MKTKILYGIVLIFCFAISLTSCDTEPKTKIASDGYIFDLKEYEKTNVDIQFVLSKDAKEFQKYREEFLPDDSLINAFSVLTPSQNKCIVYIRDPEWAYQPELIGHEVAHCIWGKWHIDPDPDSKKRTRITE